MNSMKTCLERLNTLTVAALFFLPANIRANGSAEFVSMDQLRSRVTYTAAGISVSQVLAGSGATVLVARRDKTGEIEIPLEMNDIVVAQNGHATVLVDGVADKQREIAPGELRGGRMVGAKVYGMSPGDLL